MSERTILITGGSGKFGRILVAHFLARDCNVRFTARSEASIAAVCDLHSQDARDGRLAGFVADFSSPDGITSLISALTADGQHPTGLVNNARSLDFLKIEPDGMVARENFIGEFLVDVVTPYELTMALALQSGSRLQRVVNIGSQYGSVAANSALYTDFHRQSPLHYSVAKAALAQLTREMAVRLAARNIQVNCVAFGGVEGRVDDAFKARYAALTPMGRMLNDNEIAGPVDYLLSDACSGMTGHIMAVDGGWTAW